MTLDSGKPLTFGSLHVHFQAFGRLVQVSFALLSLLILLIPNKIKIFKNVVNECLVEADPSQLVGRDTMVQRFVLAILACRTSTWQDLNLLVSDQGLLQGILLTTET